MKRGDLASSIEDFARFSAAFDRDPPHRPALLANAGLDQGEWLGVEAHWADRLRRAYESNDESESLLFRHAYESEMQEQACRASEPTSQRSTFETFPSVPQHFQTVSHWSSEGTHEGAVVDRSPAPTPIAVFSTNPGRAPTDQTLELVTILSSRAPTAPTGVTPNLLTASPHRMGLEPVSPDSGDETVIPMSFPEIPRGKKTSRRLIYFDPQTGEKLANPIWVDVLEQP